MMNTEMNQLEVSPQQHTALSRWDNEGGAQPHEPAPRLLRRLVAAVAQELAEPGGSDDGCHVATLG